MYIGFLFETIFPYSLVSTSQFGVLRGVLRLNLRLFSLGFGVQGLGDLGL